MRLMHHYNQRTCHQVAPAGFCICITRLLDPFGTPVCNENNMAISLVQ